MEELPRLAIEHGWRRGKHEKPVLAVHSDVGFDPAAHLVNRVKEWNGIGNDAKTCWHDGFRKREKKIRRRAGPPLEEIPVGQGCPGSNGLPGVARVFRLKSASEVPSI
jgi:hypothetical protein